MGTSHPSATACCNKVRKMWLDTMVCENTNLTTNTTRRTEAQLTTKWIPIFFIMEQTMKRAGVRNGITRSRGGKRSERWRTEYVSASPFLRGSSTPNEEGRAASHSLHVMYAVSVVIVDVSIFPVRSMMIPWQMLGLFTLMRKLMRLNIAADTIVHPTVGR